MAMMLAVLSVHTEAALHEPTELTDVATMAVADQAFAHGDGVALTIMQDAVHLSVAAVQKDAHVLVFVVADHDQHAAHHVNLDVNHVHASVITVI